MQARGFTLLEFLSVLGILSILVLASIPAWHTLFLRQAQHKLVWQTRQGLSMARLSAIRLQQLVLFCGSSDQLHCDGHWSKGQIVLSEQGQLLYRYPEVPRSLNLVWRSNFGKNQAIKWLPMGIPEGQQGSFKISAAGLTAQIIVLNRAGRIRIES